MTDREKAIIMAHTGVCMLAGEKYQIFHKYIEEIMGRPVLTHEIAFLAGTIKEKSKADFIALCAEQEPKTGHWEKYKHMIYCSECGASIEAGYLDDMNYCHNCGSYNGGENNEE